ncbi:alpha-L-rhamnosidase [Streptomyces sp. NP160]|nr:alpha-L-rhamnosidase [Streptomyces sp. NP160]
MDLLERATLLTADGAARGEVVVLSGELQLERPRSAVVSARVAATAQGVYDLALDGAPVGEDLLAPGWTAYEWRLQVQEHDVTDAVRAGAGGRVRLSARLGNGWWRGGLGFAAANADYGDETGLLAVLEVTYDDGAVQRLATAADGSWTAATCEVVENSLYGGERVDARLRDRPGRGLSVREGAFEREDGRGGRRLVPQVAAPVRRQEVLRAQRVWTSPSGATLVDVGQNLVGWVRLAVPGAPDLAGAEVVLRHAEVLEGGELGTRPLRGAAATDVFVLSGADVDVFEPSFTFHGFRYVEVTGFPGDHDALAEALEAVVVGSQLRRTGTFACSEPLVDQLVSNSVWGQKGNFLSVPTDCPQRDERLGWTGDIAVYAPTAAFQFDVADFLHSWLLDVPCEMSHRPDGAVPVTVPDVLKHARFDGPPPFPEVGAQAIWSDAAAWVPLALWTAYGDLDRLAAHYPGVLAHIASVEPLLSPSGLWDSGMQLADWLDPDAPPDAPWQAKAHPGVVATASFHRSVAFAAEAARLLGHDDDAERLTVLAARLRTAFRAAYVHRAAADAPDGATGLRVESDCATVYALAVCFGMLEDDEEQAAADRLAQLVESAGHRVSTGFAGTPYVTWALSEHGHVETAYRLLLETGCPSWLYTVSMGATTVWERWDSMLPDGSINPGEMTSFNHYALGAVCDWVYQVVGGLRPAEPGYRRVRVQPVPGPGITWASTALDSPVGRIEVDWRSEGGELSVRVSLPEGVPADVVLPDGTARAVVGGEHELRCSV